MAIKIRAGLAAASAFFLLPGIAFAQQAPPSGLSGAGQGWSTGPVPQYQLMGTSPLGPPPAGVLLHQQYMSLYGLPSNFNQQQQGNSQQQNGYGGGYPGGYGGGYPGGGVLGVNYRRQVAAMQMQAAYYNAVAASAYYNNNNNANAISSQRPASSSFATGYLGSSQPAFATPTSPLPNSSAGFSGFGLNTANPFVTADPAKKDETKKDESKKDESKKDEKDETKKDDAK